MKTYVLAMDDDGGEYRDVVVAKDAHQAIRILAMRQLTENENTLFSEARDSLLDYVHGKEITREYVAGTIVHCPYCGTTITKVATERQISSAGLHADGNKHHLCLSCAYLWRDGSFDEDTLEILKRRAIEEEEIIDEFERQSLISEEKS